MPCHAAIRIKAAAMQAAQRNAQSASKVENDLSHDMFAIRVCVEASARAAAPSWGSHDATQANLPEACRRSARNAACGNLAEREVIPVLLVEDDRELARALVSSLAQSGYAADLVHDGHSAMHACRKTHYQLVILDLGLPDVDGIEVLRSLRADGLGAPILILTARYDLDHRVMGLDAGGDDYLAKPFALSELEARIRALLRRGAPLEAPVKFGDLVYAPTIRQASVHGRDLALTAREVAVLEMLLRRPGRVVSKSQILESVYDHAQDANPSMIEVFVSRLRRKLGDARSRVQIRALRGLGYRLEETENE
jgi:DNA-binding response OmpR family regulator